MSSSLTLGISSLIYKGDSSSTSISLGFCSVTSETLKDIVFLSEFRSFEMVLRFWISFHWGLADWFAFKTEVLFKILEVF